MHRLNTICTELILSRFKKSKRKQMFHQPTKHFVWDAHLHELCLYSTTLLKCASIFMISNLTINRINIIWFTHIYYMITASISWLASSYGMEHVYFSTVRIDFPLCYASIFMNVHLQLYMNVLRFYFDAKIGLWKCI